jgi:iron complex transport system substrate-binding protein
MRKTQARSKLMLLVVLAMLCVCNAASGSPSDSSRVVSTGGSITEILYALGLQQKIVAVDTSSLYPARALEEKPNVGYMRQLSAEGVLGLSPTLIFAIDGSGPKETLAVLEQAKVPLVLVPDEFSGDGVVAKIRLVSRAIGFPERGECLAGLVQKDLAALAAIRGEISRRKTTAFVLSLAGDRPLIAGRATAAAGIIAMAGVDNAFDDFEGYKPVNDEAIIAAKPDVVLVMQRGQHALSADTAFAQAGLAMTPAAAHRALIAMDGLYLLGFGPRVARWCSMPAAGNTAERASCCSTNRRPISTSAISSPCSTRSCAAPTMERW